ncbi:ABC transporter ATP-binding protein [Gaoshiqia sediminis]|uniref:ABC transporter ATP-binding protein n=1 Tax=Gaoshiqia sediminis TaxID=2986998 RepID=A0AA42C985_9BACT|nr:ABC transporter ATP-binding protein [Gaoshiqia sediminis]MCW0482177.1 ABC transporter ATP-binding protein [Gaoshiqia sediminis]
MLEVKALTKSFLSGSGEKRIILDQLELTVREGESVAIVGPSGSGKTTLLNMLGALDKPESGEILLDSEPVFNKNEKELAEFRNRSIGFVFQLHHLLPQLNLEENVLLPVMAQQKKVNENQQERADMLIKKLGIGSLKGQKPGQLSGGECQRTAVARALINQPKILLADEPTGALDQHSAEQLADLLLQLNKEEQVSLIVVTHSMALAAKMDKIYQLIDGKLKLAAS